MCIKRDDSYYVITVKEETNSPLLLAANFLIALNILYKSNECMEKIQIIQEAWAGSGKYFAKNLKE